MDMSVILPILRVRIGLAADDTTKDTELTLSFNTAVALAENYCDRKFDYKADAIEYFTYDSDKTISLERYPLLSITSITTHDSQIVTPPIRFDRKAGIVYLCGYANDEELTVEYAGGYQVLPDDLLQAFLFIFDGVWKDNSGSSGGSTPTGDIKAISIPDVGRVEFDTGSAAASSTGDWGMIPDNATAILSHGYRREYA